MSRRRRDVLRRAEGSRPNRHFSRRRRNQFQALEQRLLMAADGLDASFGDAGRVLTSFGAYATANAVLEQPDGKLVVGGGINLSPFTGHSGAFEFVLARYNADGSLDASFGSGGKVETPDSVISASGSDLVRQPDGKFIMVGSGGQLLGPPVGAIARYNADGSLDSTFASAGKVIVSDAYYSQVALQPDGRIVVGGSVLRRYNPDGTLDTTFGSGGTAAYGSRRLLLEPDGKILIAGSQGELRRFNADGSPDATFGNSGVVGPSYLAANSLIALQADGTILWGGYVPNDSQTQSFQLERLKADGALDRILTIMPGADISAMHVQPDGKIVLGGTNHVLQTISAGTVVVSPEARFQALRLNADGTRDTSFGANGEEQTSFGLSFPANVTSLAIQSDGQIVLAGGAGQFQIRDFALARISTDFNRSYVDHLYLDLLGRPADPAGESFFTKALAQNQLDRMQVAARLIASNEYHSHEVVQVYETYLRRQPDAAGLSYWTEQLDSGDNRSQLEAGILASDEYFRRQGGGTNAGYVEALYRDLLSRDVDPGSAQIWGQALAAGISRSFVAEGILSSLEFFINEIGQLYPSLLNRTPDASGLDYFERLLSTGAPPELATNYIVASQEYFTGA